MGNKHNSINLFLETYNYDVWRITDTARKSDKEESTDTTRKSDKEVSIDLSDMSPLEGDEEVKEGKGLKILNLNQLLTWLPVLLAQVNAGNNANKSKKKIRQIMQYLYQHNKIKIKINKSLQQFNHAINNNEKKYGCDKRSLNFLF